MTIQDDHPVYILYGNGRLFLGGRTSSEFLTSTRKFQITLAMVGYSLEEGLPLSS